MKNFYCRVFVLGLILFVFPSSSVGYAGVQSSGNLNLSQEKLFADTWISQLASPDERILSASQINIFNQSLQQSQLTVNLLDDLPYDVAFIKKELTASLDQFWHGNYFDIKGHKASPDFFLGIKENLNLIHWDKMKLAFAFVTHRTDQRLIPTDDVLTEKPGDVDFDEIQNSSLDLGTPLLIVHESRDGNWLYTQTASSRGWVKREDLVICELSAFHRYYDDPSVVVTSAKAVLYQDLRGNKDIESVRMGARFIQGTKQGRHLRQIFIPMDTGNPEQPFVSAFIRIQDVSVKNLPYTPRTIITQAFKMLGLPYGWGGKNGEQDCSAFIQQIYRTVGIELPRNSAEQGQVGKSLGDFDQQDLNRKLQLLNTATPGSTVLQMKGHIVLYLGMRNGVPYAIHATSSYRQMVNGIEKKIFLNRVVVSDLQLGEGSSRGSLLKRIIAMRALQ